MVKINSPPANSRSATNVRPPKSLLRSAAADSNRSGKIGTKSFPVRSPARAHNRARARKMSHYDYEQEHEHEVALMKISLNGETVDTHDAKTIAELIER